MAVDCDDLRLPSTEFIVSKYNSLYDANVLLKNAHRSGNDEWGEDRSIVHALTDAIQQLPSYGQLRPSLYAVEAISQLAQSHELHLVTAWTDSVFGVTEKMIKGFFYGCFTSVECIRSLVSKGDTCVQIKANVLIEDNIKHFVVAERDNVALLLWFGDYEWQDYTTVPEYIKRSLGLKSAINQINEHAK